MISLFIDCSSLSLNLSKTLLIGVNVDNGKFASVAGRLRCKIDCLPINYTGFPPWQLLMDKFRAKITVEELLVSKGGCLTLINLIPNRLP